MTVQIEFDDIVYSLQPFGGISEYWRQVTRRVEAQPGFAVRRSTGSRWGRMAPRRSTAQVFHSSYFRIARGRRVRNVTTVHDMAFEMGFVSHGSLDALKSKLHCLEHRRAYFASDALICISESTRRDLLAVYPALASRRIEVIPHGVALAAPNSTEHRGREAVAPYLLFVGKRSTYKNFFGALEGFAASGLARSGMTMRCTGHAFSADELRRINDLGLSRAICSVGSLDETQLASQYARAWALVYPSIFEGFGLPILEAMKLGCPVIAYSGSCIPEVAGDAALLVDTRDPGAIARALLELQDPTIRQNLVERGRIHAAAFSWERSAQAHGDLYSSICGANQ